MIIPRRAPSELAVIDATEVTSGSVVHIGTLGVQPLDTVGSVINANGSYRLGVDLLKRGSFEASGEYGTIDRTWLISENVTVANAAPAVKGQGASRRLRVVGSTRTGMRTFERAFMTSTPATLSAVVTPQNSATISFLVQRRAIDQSREEGLTEGPLLEIGTINLQKAN